MNFLISILLLFQQYRGNSTTTSDYNDTFTSLDWLKLLFVIFVIWIIVSIINNFKDKKVAKQNQEKEIAEKKREEKKEKEINDKKHTKLMNLNGIYEESDILKGYCTYLKAPILEKEHKLYTEKKRPINDVFKAKNREDFDRLLHKDNIMTDDFNLFAKPYLLNGVVNIRDNYNEIIEKVYYLDGAKDYSLYYEYNGILRQGCTYVGGNEGQIAVETNYENGKIHGTKKIWFENSQLNYEWHYKHGKKHGIMRCWLENGQLEYEKNYKNGKEMVL